MPQIEGALTPNENGWRRVSVWEDDSEATGEFGDWARGKSYTARYAGNGWWGDVSYYVEVLDLHPEDPRNGKFGVQCRTETWKATDVDHDNAETDDDYGDARVFETLPEAEAVAKEHALRDESHTYMV